MWQVVHKLITAVAVIITLILLLLFIISNNKNIDPILVHTLDSACLINETSCLISLPNLPDLEFQLSPKPIPVMEPISLKIYGIAQDQISLKIWFEGKDMNMGKHYMQAISSAGKSGTLGMTEYKGMIPVCSIDNSMIWLLMIEIPNNNTLFRIQFQLSEQ